MAVTAAANALATVADVKYTWGRKQDDTGQDDRVQTLINNISGRIESWCGRKFKEATYTDEYYDGPNGYYLFLKQYPVTDTPVVKLDGNTVSASTYTVYPNEGMIRGSWIPGHKNYTVTYKAGFATIPQALAEICIEWCIILLEGRMKDARIDGADVEFYEPQNLIMGLAPFKRMDF